MKQAPGSKWVEEMQSQNGNQTKRAEEKAKGETERAHRDLTTDPLSRAPYLLCSTESRQSAVRLLQSTVAVVSGARRGPLERWRETRQTTFTYYLSLSSIPVLSPPDLIHTTSNVFCVLDPFPRTRHITRFYSRVSYSNYLHTTLV